MEQTKMLTFVRMMIAMTAICMCGAGVVLGQISQGGTPPSFSLARAAESAGLALRIFSDSAPLARAGMAPLAGNLRGLRDAVRRARAVVLPITDGYPNEAAGNSIAFMAMACGRPVIIRRTPYLEKFIKDGENGFFYKKLSAPELSRQLGRALSLGVLAARRFGAAARAAVLEKASLDSFAARLAREHL